MPPLGELIMVSRIMTIRLSSGLKIELDPAEWPEIGMASRTSVRNGGYIAETLIVRRHEDGRTLIYLDADPGAGVWVQGDIFPARVREIEGCVYRFSEQHGLPDWVAEKCVESIRG